MDIRGLSNIITPRHAAIYDVLYKSKKPLTDRQIAGKLKMADPNKVRPRLTELKNMGLVTVVGTHRDKHTNKSVRKLAAVIPKDGVPKRMDAKKGKKCPRTFYVLWSDRSKFTGEAFKKKNDAMEELENPSRHHDTVLLEVKVSRILGRAYPTEIRQST